MCGSSSEGMGGCLSYATYSEAVARCDQYGARLCNVQEQAVVAGTGCGYDSDKVKVWAAASCGLGATHHLVMLSRKADEAECSDDASPQAVRCCADDFHRPPASPPPKFSLWQTASQLRRPTIRPPPPRPPPQLRPPPPPPPSVAMMPSQSPPPPPASESSFHPTINADKEDMPNRRDPWYSRPLMESEPMPPNPPLSRLPPPRPPPPPPPPPPPLPPPPPPSSVTSHTAPAKAKHPRPFPPAPPPVVSIHKSPKTPRPPPPPPRRSPPLMSSPPPAVAVSDVTPRHAPKQPAAKRQHDGTSGGEADDGRVAWEQHLRDIVSAPSPPPTFGGASNIASPFANEQYETVVSRQPGQSPPSAPASRVQKVVSALARYAYLALAAVPAPSYRQELSALELSVPAALLLACCFCCVWARTRRKAYVPLRDDREYERDEEDEPLDVVHEPQSYLKIADDHTGTIVVQF